jgi:SAM-dependent methyltransferase
MLISDAYREQNRLLHEQRDDYGRSGQQWAPYIYRLMEEEGFATVLDWGCGKGTLAAALAPKGKTIAEYDPAIPGKDATPEPAELVVCTDVLEHIEPVHVNAVIRELRRVTKRKLFLNIATRPAAKTLPDGRNAHLIVQDADWWRAKLASQFDIHTWQERPGMVYGEATPKGAFRKPTKRRKMTPEMAAQLEFWKKEINTYADAFSRIDTVAMWESVDDQPADLQVAVRILEHVPDISKALADLGRLARKGVIICLELDERRDADWWKRLLEKRFRFAQWQVENGHVLMIGAPMVNVQGVTAIGAVDSDKRWEQVVAATKRITKRIEPAPAHAKRAIIACYGPSLKDDIESLRAAAAEPDTVVVSVSGSHDFLIERGIVPNYHVECDPRPHKADNIAKGHPGVQYLLASTVHEVLFDKLRGHDIRLWHVSTPEHAVRLVVEIGEQKEHVISGGGSVGLRSIPLLYAMGYRALSIYAMDCSFADEGKQQWAGKHAGKRQDLCQVDCHGRIFVSSPVLMTYATNFFEMVQKVEDLDVRLYGDGLLQAMARYYMGAPQVANVTALSEAAA